MTKTEVDEGLEPSNDSGVTFLVLYPYSNTERILAWNTSQLDLVDVTTFPDSRKGGKSVSSAINISCKIQGFTSKLPQAS